MSPAAILALIEGILSILDLVDRLSTSFNSEAEREAYILKRTAVRKSLLEAARLLKDPPTDPPVPVSRPVPHSEPEGETQEANATPANTSQPPVVPPAPRPD